MEKFIYRIDTHFNNGNIDNNGFNYTNKCLFVSLADGLIDNKLEYFYKDDEIYNISPFNLYKCFGYNILAQNELFDTDQEKHLECLKNFTVHNSHIKLEFFIGFQLKSNKTKWFSNMDPEVVIETGTEKKTTISILNKGMHFEYIMQKTIEEISDSEYNQLLIREEKMTDELAELLKLHAFIN